MVLEALVAVGLAGNLVQFVHFVSGLIFKSCQIYQSASGLPGGISDFDSIAKHLEKYTQEFSKTSVGHDDEASIGFLASRCGAVAVELLGAIKELQPKGNRSKGLGKWESFRQALKSVRKKEEVSTLQSRLESLRDELMLHLVARNGNQLSDATQMLSKLQEANLQSGLALNSQIQDFATKLQQIEESLPFYTQALSDLRREFSQLCAEFKELSRDCQTLQKITESLTFPCMSVRYSNIAEAHARTFDWIFRSHCLPDSDERSTIGLASWLRFGDGIYWISGKPGSGKSTLMKYLERSPNRKNALLGWADKKDLITASFYFWNPGTEMQKSLSGLLQSLLHTILVNCPALIPLLCPTRVDRHSIAASNSWTTTELREAFDILKEHGSLPVRFCFHIDGLDEYNGDHIKMIEILKSLARAPSVKILVSSRPWNCFRDAFGGTRDQKLDLHSLTMEDITLFARETLQKYAGEICLRDSALGESLVTEIAKRAQGVFLWVYLVVRSLRDGILNGDSTTILQKRLRAIPTDLEPFFEQILRTVDPVYSEYMARTLLVALDSPFPLKIVHYSFLDEENPNYGFQLHYQQFDKATLHKRVTQTHKRLNGRYKGLLEVWKHGEDIEADDAVNFLHRTLRDYLLTPQVRKRLLQDLPPDFDAFVHIGSVYLAEAKFVLDCHPRSFRASIYIASKITQMTEDVEVEFKIYDHVERVLRLHWREMFATEPGQIMLKITIHQGRTDYFNHRTKTEYGIEDISDLLRHALFCRLNCHDSFAKPMGLATYAETPERSASSQSKLVKTLLEAGANPNARMGSSTIFTQFFTWLVKSAYDLSSYTAADDYPKCYTAPGFNIIEVLRLLLQHGADVNKHCELWMGYFCRNLSWAYCPNTYNERLECIMQSIEAALEHKLDPNTVYKERSLWSLILDLTATCFSNSKSATAEKRLIHSFLVHGANITCLYVDGTAGPSWFTRTLDRIHKLPFEETWDCDLTFSFDVLLSHGLDPNVQVNGRTLWEHITDAVRENIEQAKLNTCKDPTNLLPHWGHTLIILFLQYGADPFIEKLHDLLQMNLNGRSVFGEQRILDIKAALQKEMDHVLLKSASSASNSLNTTIAKRRRECGNSDYDLGHENTRRAPQRLRLAESGG